MEKSDGSMPFPRVSDAGEEREGKKREKGREGRKRKTGATGASPVFPCLPTLRGPFFNVVELLCVRVCSCAERKGGGRGILSRKPSRRTLRSEPSRVECLIFVWDFPDKEADREDYRFRHPLALISPQHRDFPRREIREARHEDSRDIFGGTRGHLEYFCFLGTFRTLGPFCLTTS